MKRIHLALLFPLALSVAGCPGSFQEQKTQQDIDGLKKEMAELKADSKKGETTAQLRQRLADLGAQMDQLRTDLSLLQGRIETVQNDLSKKGDDSLKMRQDLEIRIAQLDEQVRTIQQKVSTMPTGATLGTAASTPAQPTATTMTMATPAPSPLGTFVPPDGNMTPPKPHPTTPGMVIKAAETPAPKETDQALYQRGVEAFDAKRYGDARATFSEVVTKFPKSEFADNAIYWRGESFYAEKDFASAALEFEKVTKEYPNGDKVPAAMLKEGYAFIELGEKDGGAQTLRDLIKKYPKTEEAKKAKERLSKLK